MKRIFQYIFGTFIGSFIGVVAAVFFMVMASGLLISAFSKFSGDNQSKVTIKENSTLVNFALLSPPLLNSDKLKVSCFLS